MYEAHELRLRAEQSTSYDWRRIYKHKDPRPLNEEVQSVRSSLLVDGDHVDFPTYVRLENLPASVGMKRVTWGSTWPHQWPSTDNEQFNILEAVSQIDGRRWISSLGTYSRDPLIRSQIQVALVFLIHHKAEQEAVAAADQM